MGNRRLSLAALALMVTGLLAACSGGTEPATAEAKNEIPKFSYQPGVVAPFVTLSQARTAWTQAEAVLAPKPVAAKGIYLTSYSAANPAKFQELVDLVDRTELNAMVVNVKDDWGNVTFTVTHPIAVAAGAVHPDLGDMKAFTSHLRAKGIYSIARIVTFKDSHVPKYRPDLAVASTAGGIWRDYNGVPWLNPYNRAAWDYVVEIAREAALVGFDEIQFDYVRFPTDGNMSLVSYPGKDDRERQQVIADFLAYARKELRPYGVWVSADVFGLVTSLYDDLGIGQHLEEISAGVDIVSPMVYPSHYIPGNLNLSNPNAMPYETVYRSMLDAKGRWEKAGLTGKVTMRPWLQDFSWGHPYGPKEVRDQIQATYDAGYDQWILWNAANEYTEAALKPAGKE
ncbi:MAG TPA: putative glycoside hydrolase [Symbiobacteriaceae bacterium]|nr:putative glycoside hydrolase [Symbiobacteriaceae bacterium]